ncbi:hypothetical protein IMSHALPRED_008919 [Imshaugia aleurites]|uniref:Uncharacterized protein n=1 Tax=Imshaugia aleurites TaxID=172621 RepID=A0A8H3FXM2_9LECA|nr:hypothetical protein IMSHALPRED_008919 [Imshaugia aleurites]
MPTGYHDEVFNPSISHGMTAMAPPPLPKKASSSSYLTQNLNDDFGLQSHDFPIFLPLVHPEETSLWTPLDLLAPPEPPRPASPLLEVQQTLSAMQNIISHRLLLAKEYGKSLAIEGAFRKAEWERDRERRMGQNRTRASTAASSSNATKNTPYIDWSPISAGASPPTPILPSTPAKRPRSKTTIQIMDPASMPDSLQIQHPNTYLPTTINTTPSAPTNTTQPLFPLPSSDPVPLTIQYRLQNPLTGATDPYHEILSVPASIRLDALKQAIWISIQNGYAASAGALAMNGWIQSLVVHWDVDKQVYHGFPPTTELRDEVLECLLGCLRDGRGFDWVEVGVEMP